MPDEFITPKKGKTFKPTSQVEENAIEYYKRIVDVTEMKEIIVEEEDEIQKLSDLCIKEKKDKKVACNKKKKIGNNKNDKITKVMDDEFDKEIEILSQYKKEQAQVDLHQKKIIKKNKEPEIVMENELLTDFSSLKYTPQDIHNLFTEMFYDIHNATTKQ